MAMTQGPGTESAPAQPFLGLGGEPAELEFEAGLPGFPSARRFTIEDLGQNLAPFCRIRCAEDRSIAFTVVPPGLIFPDYTVEIDEDHVSQLGLDSADDVVTLVIVTVPQNDQVPTANLLGPIVVNRNNLRSAQVVQHGSSYKVAEPIVSQRS